MSNIDCFSSLTNLELSHFELPDDDVIEIPISSEKGKKEGKVKQKCEEKILSLFGVEQEGCEIFESLSPSDDSGSGELNHRTKKYSKTLSEIEKCVEEESFQFLSCELKYGVDWKDGSDMDDLATVANAALNGDEYHNGKSNGKEKAKGSNCKSDGYSNGFEENGDGEDQDDEEDEDDGDHQLQADDELDLDGDDTTAHKTFKERAVELMKKTQGEHSHLVKRTLNSDDWLFMHRIIRKSKGLKSKFMMKNLGPYLFDSDYVNGWNCQHCRKMISTPVKNYVDHLLTDHGLKEDDDPLFPCDICGDYVKKDKYIVHWVPHLMEHTCPICKKTFALNCHMKYHYKVVHEEGEQTCLQCGKLMKNDLAMRRHLRLFHSNRTNWKICDICGKCVKSRCLEPHKLTHSQDRPFRCDVCKKCFKTPSTLYQHQKVHATDSRAHKYLCEYCGKRFKHHTSWNLHVVRIHEGEYEHECPVCRKRFHKLFELKKHSVKHSEDRPFPCSTCGKHFKTKTHLKEHVTIHSNEKNHICPLCGKGIRMKANLYKHLKVHRNRGEFVPPISMSSNTSHRVYIDTSTPATPLRENSNSATSTTTSPTSNSKSSSPRSDLGHEQSQPTLSSILNSLSGKLQNIVSEDIDSTSKSTLDNLDLLMSSGQTDEEAQLPQSQMIMLENDEHIDDNSPLNHNENNDSVLPLNLNLPHNLNSDRLSNIASDTIAGTSESEQYGEDSMHFSSLDDVLMSNTASGDHLNVHNHHNHLQHHHTLPQQQNPNDNSAILNLSHSANDLSHNNSTTNVNITLPSSTATSFPSSLLSLIAAAAQQTDGFRFGNSLTHLTILINHNNQNYINENNPSHVIASSVLPNTMNTTFPVICSNNFPHNSIINNDDSNLFLNQCINNNTITTNINTLLNHIDSQNNPVMQFNNQVNITGETDGNLQQMNTNATTISLTYHPNS